ncbi:MAG TPA: hypothetical protein VH590_10075, partial [Ktedonobacterales bacterium]
MPKKSEVPLMQCPQCSATIAERDTVCPSCRYVLPTPAAISISIAQQQRQEPVHMPLQWPFRKLMLGLGVVLIGFAIYACVALLLG